MEFCWKCKSGLWPLVGIFTPTRRDVRGLAGSSRADLTAVCFWHPLGVTLLANAGLLWRQKAFIDLPEKWVVSFIYSLQLKAITDDQMTFKGSMALWLCAQFWHFWLWEGLPVGPSIPAHSHCSPWHKSVCIVLIIHQQSSGFKATWLHWGRWIGVKSMAELKLSRWGPQGQMKVSTDKCTGRRGLGSPCSLLAFQWTETTWERDLRVTADSSMKTSAQCAGAGTKDQTGC